MEIKAIKSFEKSDDVCWESDIEQTRSLPTGNSTLTMSLFVCNVFVAVSEVRAFAVVANGNVKTKLINRHLTKLRK